MVKEKARVVRKLPLDPAVFDLELYRSIDASCQIAYIWDGTRLDPMQMYRERIAERAGEVLSQAPTEGREQIR